MSVASSNAAKAKMTLFLFDQRDDLRDFIADVNSCRVVVTGDTLTMHIALALRKAPPAVCDVARVPRVWPERSSKVAVALSGDGHLDLAVTSGSFGTGAWVSLFHGQGDATFVAGPVIETPHLPRDLAIADLDQDGKNDLLVAVAHPVCSLPMSSGSGGVTGAEASLSGPSSANGYTSLRLCQPI